MVPLGGVEYPRRRDAVPTRFITEKSSGGHERNSRLRRLESSGFMNSIPWYFILMRRCMIENSVTIFNNYSMVDISFEVYVDFIFHLYHPRRHRFSRIIIAAWIINFLLAPFVRRRFFIGNVVASKCWSSLYIHWVLYEKLRFELAFSLAFEFDLKFCTS